MDALICTICGKPRFDGCTCLEAGDAYTPPEPSATVPPPNELAREQDILSRFAQSIGSTVVGEVKLAKLVFLTIVTQHLDRPTSLAVKGLSSGGKSYTVEATVDHFPPEATHRLTGMSEHFLIYDEEPVAHRTLLLYEYVALKTGMKDDQTSYFVRSLLSEGVLRHGTVEKTKDGLKSRIIEKPGPTNLIVTTTEVSLHAENETRCLSVTVDDSNEQTRRVLLRIAQDVEPTDDLQEWHALHRWLATQDNRVVVAYATRLAQLVPPVAVRLRRDFGAVLALIKAHALLHQLNRGRDEYGRIIATLEDYRAVRHIVADVVSEGVGATVSESMRETVLTVGMLAGDEGMTAADLGRALDLDKSAARRRLRAASHRGYVKNLEERRGRPGRYVTDEPMPDQVDVLPPPDHLIPDETAGQASGGTVASESEGVIEDPYEEGKEERDGDGGRPDLRGDQPGFVRGGEPHLRLRRAVRTSGGVPPGRGTGPGGPGDGGPDGLEGSARPSSALTLDCVRCGRYGPGHPGDHITEWPKGERAWN